MKKIENTKYTTRFFKDFEDDSQQSADIILEILFGLFKIESVVDYGCGTGAWLHAARKLGATKTTGVDGPWVTREMLVDPDIELVTADLSLPLNLGVKADLAISVEVGEHVPKSCADGLVKALCETAPRILFGAAIPGQGGTSHINEQWQSYWAEKFAANGYMPVDIVRPQVYNDKSILPWYRNNSILYVRNGDYLDLMTLIITKGNLKTSSIDLVIPDIFERPGLRHSLRILSQVPHKLFNAIYWRLRIWRF